mmetsp:Transcript_595/g.1488  ORF Transcript_595/g.1488 Transcript_595/m.1488 type:complete len:216 (+) Transcript_595:348-995(+)
MLAALEVKGRLRRPRRFGCGGVGRHRCRVRRCRLRWFHWGGGHRLGHRLGRRRGRQRSVLHGELQRNSQLFLLLVTWVRLHHSCRWRRCLWRRGCATTDRSTGRPLLAVNFQLPEHLRLCWVPRQLGHLFRALELLAIIAFCLQDLYYVLREIQLNILRQDHEVTLNLKSHLHDDLRCTRQAEKRTQLLVRGTQAAVLFLCWMLNDVSRERLQQV